MNKQTISERICPYCKEVLLLSSNVFSNHVKNCNKNPKSELIRNILKENGRVSAKLIQEKFNLKLGEYKDFLVTCFREECKSNFLVSEREFTFPKKEKYYCSNKCAYQGNKKTEIEKEIFNFKIILSGRNGPNSDIFYYNCKNENCNKLFISKTTNRKLPYCSLECKQNCKVFIKENLIPTNEKKSRSAKKKYQDGYSIPFKVNIKSRTKWHKVNTSIGVLKLNGTYEVRMVSILEKWKEIGKIKEWEYTNDRFQYQKIGEEISSTYLLDFKVFNNDNSFYYIETKGWYDANDFRKWSAVQKAGYRIEIWEDKQLKIEETINRK